METALETGLWRALERAGAARAAVEVARRHGLRVTETRLLKDSNNIVLRLAPLPLVAKVANTRRRPSSLARLRTELEVAQHLFRMEVPVSVPSPELPAEVHRCGQHAVTFWGHRDNDADAPVGDRAAACLLKAVHQGLDCYQGHLPLFTDRQLRCAGAVLADPRSLPTLSPSDRTFLADAYACLKEELLQQTLNLRPLHGDPHRGNLLACRGGCVLIDFESACCGPLEWDLSALPGEGAGVFDADAHLLALLRQLRSICVAVWCWMRPHRAEEIDQAARSHVNLLRRSVGVCQAP